MTTLYGDLRVYVSCLTGRSYIHRQTSFRDEAKAMRDQSDRLEGANAKMQAEVDRLRQQLMVAERNLRNAAESKSSGDADMEGNMRDLERSLEEAKEENNKRINETSQFQQMRKLMQSQSANIRDLRKRLQKYEPDACKEEDDRDNY